MDLDNPSFDILTSNETTKLTNGCNINIDNKTYKITFPTEKGMTYHIGSDLEVTESDSLRNVARGKKTSADSDSAKNAVEGVKKAITSLGGTEEDAKNIKQSGKLVYFGTDDAISAAG